MQEIREQATTIEQQTENLVTVFEQMRSWSAILQELGNRIPSKVQIESLEHQQITTLSTKTEQLEIRGYALNFKTVNQFLLNIGKSKLFNAKNSRITMAELVDAPPVTGAIVTQQSPVEFKPPQVVKYNMTISLNDVPVSNLVRELEKKGAMGLVEKIRHLERIGAITK
jgi:type IV pilus assembly protein PilN